MDSNIKLKKAIFFALNIEKKIPSRVLLEFADGQTYLLGNDLKRTLLKDGLVALGLAGMPDVTVDKEGYKIELSGCTRDKEILRVAQIYVDYLDKGKELKDGQVLFELS